MATKFLITLCGCVHLQFEYLTIIDWNRLPLTNIQVGYLLFNDTQYLIETTFDDKTDLLNYLNTTFVEDNDLDGTFTAEGKYSNPENFLNAEIMAILETNMLRFKVGTPLSTLNVPTIDVPNGNVITHSSLVGIEVLQVVVGAMNSQPITALGWEIDNLDGTLTFPIDNYPQDDFIYVLIKQEN
jgi:hypothetical protein